MESYTGSKTLLAGWKGRKEKETHWPEVLRASEEAPSRMEKITSWDLEGGW